MSLPMLVYILKTVLIIGLVTVKSIILPGVVPGVGFGFGLIITGVVVATSMMFAGVGVGGIGVSVNVGVPTGVLVYVCVSVAVGAHRSVLLDVAVLLMTVPLFPVALPTTVMSPATVALYTHMKVAFAPIARLATLRGVGPLTSTTVPVPFTVSPEGTTLVIIELPLLFTVIITVTCWPTVTSVGTMKLADSAGFGSGVLVCVGVFVFVNVGVFDDV